MEFPQDVWRYIWCKKVGLETRQALSDWQEICSIRRSLEYSNKPRFWCIECGCEKSFLHDEVHDYWLKSDYKYYFILCKTCNNKHVLQKGEPTDNDWLYEEGSADEYIRDNIPHKCHKSLSFEVRYLRKILTYYIPTYYNMYEWSSGDYA